MLTVYGEIGAKKQTINAADYAEYFEWSDGNPNSEDRMGYFVALNTDGKIKIASAADNIIGIVSSNPGVIGNAADDEWCNKYLKDDFGRYILDANGAMQLNPEYDDTREYIPRSQRKEWAVVGMMGQIIMYDDGTCTPSGFCASTNDGKATAASGCTNIIMLSRIKENIIKVFIK